ncbi:Zn(II)2Cys6 transcription factor [Aspergillus bombycis]|uniref:Zn(II)2Cys6 transcription factor n=1 Tax=Aspergillus bombycis TaxID=109264 RepID=A0A1F8AAT4_9EURO|nr:Zn(II)2Cys6 transcription factor [Aspergillus bombycis]OGM48751.1 Zn(II)2Cys6 transcription factor [Aspergillus bombycis]
MEKWDSKVPAEMGDEQSQHAPASAQNTCLSSLLTPPFHMAVSSGAVDLKTSIQSVLDKNITPYLDHATTDIIFSRYITNMAPTFPAVVFPPSTRAADVRKNNPILLLAILDVASSGFCELEIQRKLRKLIVQTYVHCMLRSDQYTLGLLQALIVSATWYRSIVPLEPGEQMDIYQIGHTAANMALIMGLGDRLNNRNRDPSLLAEEGQADRHQSSQSELLAARRVWLGCHYICSNTSMSLRAPNVMRWTHCMDECLEVLETSPDALPSDKVLCQHVRLQRITEEAAMQLSFKGASASLTLRAMQIQTSYRLSKRQIFNWKKSIREGIFDGALQLSYHFSSLYLSEVAFCAASDAEVPSETRTSRTITIPADTFSECVETIDHIFRGFTSLDMSAIRVLPAMYLIRMIYTALILVKLHFAAVTSSNEDAQLQIDRLQVSSRLHYIIQMFAGWGPLWPATKLTTVFRRIRSWFEDSDTMKRDGSCLNVWQLGPASQSPEDDQSSTDLVGSNDGLLLSPSSQDPPWTVSMDPTNRETVPLSLNPSLDFSGNVFTPTSSDQPIDYSLLPSQASPSAPNVSVGDDLGMDLNMIEKRAIDAALDIDLELNQLPSMHFDPSSLQLPLSLNSDTFYDNYRAEGTQRND